MLWNMFIVFWLALQLLLQRIYFNPRALRMWGETKGAVGALIFPLPWGEISGRLVETTLMILARKGWKMGFSSGCGWCEVSGRIVTLQKWLVVPGRAVTPAGRSRPLGWQCGPSSDVWLPSQGRWWVQQEQPSRRYLALIPARAFNAARGALGWILYSVQYRKQGVSRPPGEAAWVPPVHSSGRRRCAPSWPFDVFLKTHSFWGSV